tara:strand:- start:524 stop:784 length:261 start_codon:yes stop_codon:yes gene_type:complete
MVPATSPRKYSLEGLVACLIMLCTAGALYGNASTKIDNLEKRLAEYETRVTPMLLELTEKTTQIQIEQQGMKSDLAWIKANLGKTK